MKYKGEQIKGPNIDVIAIPRPSNDGQEGNNDLIFQLGAVLDFSEFDAIFPEPLPPKTMVPGGATDLDFKNPDYLAQRRNWASKRTLWVILKTLSFTPELEWERVKMDDPETWDFYKDELSEAGLTPAQITFIVNRVFLVNGIDEARMEEARRRFFASRQQIPAKSS